jgi:hypothetical protein
MASGSTAMLMDRAAPEEARHFSTLRISCQASAEHFEQCAEFPLLRNRGSSEARVNVSPQTIPDKWPAV